MKLIMLKGLPGSGKSTWAKQFVLENPRGLWKRINKDNLRSMLDAGRWTRGNESFILDLRDHIIEECFKNNVNVIVDDTNFAQAHETSLRIIAKKFDAEFEIKTFDTDVNECIERDAKRANGVGKDVIWRMWSEHIIPKVEWPQDRVSKPEVVICDLDGTLANIDHRNPYNASDCEKDGFNRDVFQSMLGMLLGKQGAQYIFVSGRSDKYRKETEKWLENNGSCHAHLFMREEGDTRKDWLVKFEILRDKIMPFYNPIAVFDDRDQVVAMWRAQGLRCLQVANGNF